ncbi:MAG: DUF2608 domain-containing protein [bacterium]
MKRHYPSTFIFIFSSIFSIWTAFGYEQIQSIGEIPRKIQFHCAKNPTLKPFLFTDLDDTLIKSTHPLGWGSDKWFSTMYNHLKTHDIKNPLDIIFGVVTFVNAFFANQTTDEPFIIKTEEIVPKALNSIRTERIPVFGLTARTFILKDFTQKYLNDLGIVFSRINDAPGEDIIINEETAWKAIYSNGTIFCSGNNKGKIILEFFDKFEKLDTSEIIAFAVDDQTTNLDKIQQALLQKGIACICFHYAPKETTPDFELDSITLSWLNLIIRSNQPER